MRLEFSGSPEITAPRARVWDRLMDPAFVSRSAPGIESVETLDPSHFKVLTGLGVGAIRVQFKVDVELFDVAAPRRAKMRARGKAAGSAMDLISSMELVDEGPHRTRLNWTAVTNLSGTVAGVGARLLESTARRLTEQFWTDFARRVSAE